jgi:hypothetical protein
MIEGYKQMREGPKQEGFGLFNFNMSANTSKQHRHSMNDKHRASKIDVKTKRR